MSGLAQLSTSHWMPVQATPSELPGQTPWMPSPPQASPFGHAPQSSAPPQPSPTVPQYCPTGSSHFIGTQAGSPQMLGVPLPPHVAGAVQSPQSSALPQSSPITPQ